MRIEKLDRLGSGRDVLPRAPLPQRGASCPPAAPIGEWFDSAAMIAPSVAGVGVGAVFYAPPGDGGAVGGGWRVAGTCPTSTPAPTGAARRFPKRPAAIWVAASGKSNNWGVCSRR